LTLLGVGIQGAIRYAQSILWQERAFEYHFGPEIWICVARCQMLRWRHWQPVTCTKASSSSLGV